MFARLRAGRGRGRGVDLALPELVAPRGNRLLTNGSAAARACGISMLPGTERCGLW